MTDPFRFIPEEPIEDTRVSCVRFDGAEAASKIIEKILSDGRKHFAYLCGRNSSWIDKQRRDWFGAALGRHGLAFEAEAHGDYPYDSDLRKLLFSSAERSLTHWCAAMT